MQIKDIAALAGVGHSTVSRYLNGGYVSEEKREKIRKVIEETGYVPSQQAKSLRSKVTRQIGVIIPKINSDSISQMVSGISSVLNGEGYYLLLANVDNDENREINYLELFNNAGIVDGIILIGSVFTPKHERVMENIKLPFVILAQYHEKYSCVYHNNVAAAESIAKIVAEGRRHPAVIGTRPDDLSTGRDRKQGFLKALGAVGIDGYCEEISSYNMSGGHEACMRLIEAHPETDAIFCATDHIAAGALEYLKSAGRRVPEDVTLGCVGGTEIIDVCSPKISCANLDYFGGGKIAASLLLEKIKGATEIKHIQTDFIIQRKQTT